MSKAPHIPLALALPALIDARTVIDAGAAGFSPTEMNNLQYIFTGTGTGVKGVNFSRLVETYGKYAVGYGVHRGAKALGVNRAMARLTRGWLVL